MSTPFVEELALVSKNNEAVDETITLTERLVDGTIVPLDLSGREFFAQARRGKGFEADLMCVIQVNIVGDASEGKLQFLVPASVMKEIPQARGFYDVLTRSGPDGTINNLYQAPFIVEPGVTDLSQWQ